MDEQDYIERLKTTPVTETGFGNARTRRVIKNAGFDTLWELFALSEKEIDDCFEPDVADAIIDLRDQYRTNPEKSVSSVLQKEERDNLSSLSVSITLLPSEPDGHCTYRKPCRRDEAF